MTKILEGTWAEIAAHQDEWEGRRLRVEVQTAPAENGETENGESENGATETGATETDALTLQEAMKDLVGTVAFEPEDLGANHKKYYAQAMDEKYPRGKN